jgi:hypothetical protein
VAQLHRLGVGQPDTGAEWKRIPTGKPSARCWNVALRGDHRRGVRVATPAVKRPWRDEVPLELLGVDAVLVADSGGALNISANSRSKSMSSLATAWRSAE